MKKILIIGFLVGLFIDCKSQEILTLPGDFADRVFKHIVSLSSFGIRTAGTVAEKKTVDYLVKEFDSIGLFVTIDTFKYKTFIFGDTKCLINNDTIIFNRIILNPYQSINEIKGQCYFYNPDSAIIAINDLSGKIVFTKEPLKLEELSEKNPFSIIVITDKLFEQYSKNADSYCYYQITGYVKDVISYNIIASTQKEHDKEIIITAHWDSYNGPGANDNASGLGTIIELSRYLKSKFDKSIINLKFIALGAEEIGYLGSKAYVRDHQKELTKCLFNFNLDMVGGNDGPYLSLIGKDSIGNQDKYYPKLLANHDDKNNWKALGEEFHLKNPIYMPKWFKDNLQTTVDAVNIKVEPVGEIGTDNQLFYYAGVPSTNICIAPDNEKLYHSQEDNPEHINKESLRKAGLIVANTINITLINENNNAR
jgi:hypothetical protein